VFKSRGCNPLITCEKSPYVSPREAPCYVLSSKQCHCEPEGVAICGGNIAESKFDSQEFDLNINKEVHKKWPMKNKEEYIQDWPWLS
jgi:hypothetical protein